MPYCWRNAEIVAEMDTDCPLEQIERLAEENRLLRFALAKLHLKLLDRERELLSVKAAALHSAHTSEGWERVAMSWKAIAAANGSGHICN